MPRLAVATQADTFRYSVITNSVRLWHDGSCQETPTLIHGTRDAVLVDALTTNAQGQ
ncbi:hypothetical protein GCM10009687_38440 [Asanoa iriomotensis]|uniref:Uncharacterized protein n=1 Tax=Asanoa iriomotensis TaxID=234613 RepID=A0ABQ4CAH6_9ACTN|nr:hypothetical protein Air01nite_58760 [Asanoa iriomotensis]